LTVEGVLLAAIALTALDMRAHARVENLGGVNVWGYRGPVANAKRANEVRIVIVGGDLAFGWGVAPTETTASYVRRLVAMEIERSTPGGPVVTAFTAGARGLGPAEYARWLEHVSLLGPDVLCLLIDPPDHRVQRNDFLPDRGSLVFRRFGYSPILPLVLREKGDLVGSRAVRAAAAALGAVDDAFAARPSARNVSSDAEYLNAIDDAVRTGLRVAPVGMALAVPSSIAEAGDVSQVGAALSSRFQGEPRLRIVDLGRDPAMHDAALRLDGFFFSSAGHSRAAELISPRIVELVRSRR
jgi:hypothetical protein